MPTLRAATPTLVAVRDPDGLVAPVNDWRVEFRHDTALNNTSKRFFVPRGEEWHVLYIWIEFTTINAGGARQIVVEIEDAAHDILARVPAGATQDANTARHYFYGPGMADLTEFRDVSVDWLSTPIPPTWVLPERTNIHIYDENGVSGQDDMIVHMDIGRRLVG